MAKTVHTVPPIGGHDPPAPHIVGLEGMVGVKEKLKTVSEELEEFGVYRHGMCKEVLWFGC